MKQSKHIPPKSARRFLNWFLRDDLAEEVQGDLDEQYFTQLESTAPFRAKLNYWYQVISYLRPFAITKNQLFKFIHLAMIKNYYKIAWRSLLKHKTYSSINVLGLFIGITCFLLMSLYIYDEMTFEKMHSKKDRIYRMINDQVDENGQLSKFASTSFQLSKQAESKVPGIEKIVRIFNFGRSRVAPLSDETNSFYEVRWFANQAFLETFDFEWIRGDRNSALTDPSSTILTETMAKKLFGSLDVIGKEILSDRDSVPLKVTGILKDFPTNSHMSFNMLISETSLRDPNIKQFLQNDWYSNYFSTYLLLDNNSNSKHVAENLNNLQRSNQDENMEMQSSVWLQPLNDVHFGSLDLEQSIGTAGNKTYVLVMLIAAIFVIAIAIINYMNLATARFSIRSREIGVRKAIGAGRKSILAQILTESFLIVLISFALGLIAINVLLPYFNNFTGKSLALDLLGKFPFWISIAFIVICIGFFSGIYPAFVQSRLKPTLLLNRKVSYGRGSLPIRQILVVFQFTVSIIMIASTITIYNQMFYVKSADLGFNNEQLLVADINSGSVRRDANFIQTEFEKIAAVQSVAVSSRVPGEWKQIPTVEVLTQIADEARQNDLYFLGASGQFFSTLEMNLKSGSLYSDNNPADSNTVLLNETAAELLGISEAEEQIIRIPTVDFYGNVREFEQPLEVRVKGIVEDFNYMSLHEKIHPMVIAPSNNHVHRIDYFIAKVNMDNLPATLKSMEDIIHSVDPDHIFEYNFLDDKWNEFYAEDEKRQSIILTISLLTIFIACLGLFGLTTFMVEQRIKEIGIRKVLGANISSLTVLMSRNFVLLVGVATLVATPIAWYFLDQWLQSFAYHVNLSIWMFLLAGTVALLLALITVSFKSIKAARANPVISLRTE